MTVAFNRDKVPVDCEQCKTLHKGKCCLQIGGLKRYGIKGSIQSSPDNCIAVKADKDFVSHNIWLLWVTYRDKNILPDTTTISDIWNFHYEAFEVCRIFEMEQHEQQQRENNKQKQ